MKTAIAFCAALMMAAGLSAQTAPAPKAAPSKTAPAAVAQATNATPAHAGSIVAPGFEFRGPGQESLKLPSVLFLKQKQAAPNKIVHGRVSYSGSLVEAVKTRRPLQLFNPEAPPEYGSPEDNLARDPINGRVLGLKLFAIHF